MQPVSYDLLIQPFATQKRYWSCYAFALHLHYTVTACVIQVRFLVPKVAQKLLKSRPQTPTKKLEYRQKRPKITTDNQTLNANALHLLCICYAFGMLYKRKEKIYIHTFSYIHYRSCIRCVLGRNLRFLHTHRAMMRFSLFLGECALHAL